MSFVNWGLGPFWRDDDEDDCNRKRKRRRLCACPTPAPSIRPCGRMRHNFCTRCHGFWNLQSQINQGRVVFGIKGKHRKKPLWVGPTC